MTPPPRFLHQRREAARQSHRRHHVQIPIGLPFLVRRLHHRLVAAGAGVVDENVGAAEQPLDVGDEVFRPLARGDVAGQSFGPDAEGFGDPAGLPANPLHVAGGDDDVDALGREALGDRKTNADAAAGDDGDLPLEPEIHPAPFPLFDAVWLYQHV